MFFMMKTVYHMRSCIENTVQLRNAVFNSQKLYRIIRALISPINTKLTTPASPIDHIFTKGFIKNTCRVSQPTECSDRLILWAEEK